jgi:hypothetical protein
MANQKPPRPQPQAESGPEPSAPADGDEPSDERAGPHPHRRDRLRGIARRIFRELEDDEGPEGAEGAGAGSEPPPRGEAREMLASMLETGDKAKAEIVRLVAREVRSYLEALELHKDLHHLLTNYSLEVKASVHLKPLADALEPDTSPKTPSVSASLAPRPGADPDT